ncbi:FecR family protein [Chitinophaga niastensis]|uniref:FecR family protein n=1 Tax=Chitinophaga niastensis TaxID=536980 RepID=A0A2P8HEU4_CHINA|nr:FecR family protein [Chitinophaga niastensis]PSL44740.1 FecR family protein [Chitinophaga niastensis]
MPDTERLKYLLTRARQRQADSAEYQELLSMIQGDDSGEIIAQIDAFHASAGPAMDTDVYDQAYWQAAVKEILATDKQIPAEPTVYGRRIRFVPWKWWAAACTIFLAATGAYFLLQQHQQPAIIASLPIQDIAPGSNKAILTLADGSQITLDSATNGLLAQQGNTKITKLANGQLAYDESGGTEEKVLYNTMSTPLGGQFKLILPDGSAVWLNAGSSITYPTAFTGNERSVSITGEAYFEVAKNEKMPFRVKAGNTAIEVLGTNFNINAYKDEAAISTTLLEGAVRIHANNQQLTLKPGQQARVTPQSSRIQVINDVNLLESIAWKEGFFSFENADLPAVMRQLARWYNVEVKYEGAIPQREFTGEIGRSLTLSQVLKGLSKTRIKYRIENGNRIIIQP